MTQYLGTDVLDQVEHNARDSIREAFDRHGAAIANPTGRNFWDDFAGQPLPSRTFEWFAAGRTEVAALRAFLGARFGRLVPFWTPTYGADLEMSQDATAAQSSLRVFSVGYGEFLFPLSGRKNLAIVKPDGSFLMRKVTLVTDNGDGTETLSLDSGLGEDLAAARTQVCFLTLCRLDVDRVPIRWDSVDHAEASFPFREIPREAPA